MKVQCTTCNNYFRIRHIKEAKKPLQCKSCRPNRGRCWTKEEIDILIKLTTTTTMSMHKIADRLNMYPNRISVKIKSMRLKRPKRSNSFGERRTINGIVKVKVAKVNISKKRRRKQERLIWVALKDLTWLVHEISLPEGYEVKIRDMDKPQDSMENLELVPI